MATPRRLLVIPAAALALLAACGDDDDAADVATTVEVTTTAASATTAPTTMATSDASTTTTPPTTSTPTTAPSPSIDRPVADGGTEIIVAVGLDDAATLGGRVEAVPLGSQVTLRLLDESSAQEYHVHGYELEQAVPVGTEAVFEFTADQAGQFEVESHDTGKVLVVLDVS